jgi:hypothetical protein
MELSEKNMNILEEKDFQVCSIEKQGNEFVAEIETFSPAGEDVICVIWFDGTDQGFVKKVKEYADDFDVEEHVELYIDRRGKNGIPNTISELLTDAKAIQTKLDDLADALDTQNEKQREISKRKVLITNGMCEDMMLIITDAPKSVIENWCHEYNSELENGNNIYFNTLKKNYYVKVLFDSVTDSNFDDIEIIGYDESYDLFDFGLKERNKNGNNC